MTIQKKLREIVLDTETTGLNCNDGDRIVEIGCVELINHVPSGVTYQTYINPQRQMSKEASEISGINDDFLKDKPIFADIADDFLNFVRNDTLVIHNAKFDITFLNSELERLNKRTFKLNEVVDTLDIARKKFFGAPVNLDALCKRFNIDNSAREKHGALIDCMLLAEVYVNLLGGKQSEWKFDRTESVTDFQNKKSNYPHRIFDVSEEEISRHKEFVKIINESLWNKYYS